MAVNGFWNGLSGWLSTDSRPRMKTSDTRIRANARQYLEVSGQAFCGIAQSGAATDFCGTDRRLTDKSEFTAFAVIVLDMAWTSMTDYASDAIIATNHKDHIVGETRRLRRFSLLLILRSP